MFPHTHTQYREGPTIKELQKEKPFPIRRVRFQGFYKQLGFTDKTVMSPYISNMITLCRKSRINDNKEDFDHMANLITERNDLSFNSYEERKTFSCTEEMERLALRKFWDEYNEFFDCWVECETKFGDSHFNSANHSKCLKRCFGKFDVHTNEVVRSSLNYTNQKSILEIDQIFIDPRSRNKSQRVGNHNE